ncbi:hypothetical protein [Sphingomonas sp. MMS24-J13]|uniref:hypothetical protein n=1 Tax=Sphingomonas sp. MMS24-J13 TaxID=3238686 RepID=UPI0038514C65
MSGTCEARLPLRRLVTAWRELRAARPEQKAWRLVARAVELHRGLMPEILDMAVQAIVTVKKEV